MKIFLVGMMGSGKTYQGKLLAQQLHIPFFDLDAEIEQTQNQTIAQLFEHVGEDGFRKIESEKLRSFASLESFVLSTGGGTPCYFNNMQWMNEQGITVWLNETVETLVQRLAVKKGHRPLISHLSDSDLHPFLSNKLQERLPFYSMATLKFNSQKHTLLQLIQMLD